MVNIQEKAPTDNEGSMCLQNPRSVHYYFHEIRVFDGTNDRNRYYH